MPSDPVSLYKNLGRLIAAIAATDSRPRLYGTVAQYLPDLIPADRVSVALVQPCGDEFEVFALGGQIPDPPAGTRLPLNSSNNVGRSIIQGQPCITDLSPMQRKDKEIVQPVQQVMSAPFVSAGKAVGTINLASSTANAYGPAELELLAQVASLMASNLERLRLGEKTQVIIEQQRRYAERLEILNEVGRQLSSATTEQGVFDVVADAIQQLLSVERISYVIPNWSTRMCQVWALSGNAAIPQATQFPLAGSAMEIVIRHNQPVIFDDLTASQYPEHKKLRAENLAIACCVPVQSEGKIIGILNTAAFEPWDSPKEAETLLHALGRFMGTTLERIQVRKDVDTTLRRLEYQASHDPLTGLLNRYRLRKVLATALEQAQKEQHQLALLFIDLDRFKEINDALSHSAGDELLCTVAQRMLEQFAPPAAIARMGGDEFVVLLPQLYRSESAMDEATKLLASLKTPMQIMGHQIQIGGSIGISLFPEHASNAAELMKYADMAMYAAKQLGRDNCQIYSRKMSEQLEGRLRLQHDLKLALKRGELFLLFQPIYGAASRMIMGLEALIRWRHPTQGLIRPDLFIPLAEDCGLISDITTWVLHQSLGYLKTLHDSYPELYISVNASAQELSNPALFNQRLSDALTQSGLPGHVLELELTEHVFLEHPDTAAQVIRAWKSQGIRLAIDDFGTGFSSLNYLLNLPMDTLKIDRSFIHGLPGHERKQGVVKTILALAQNLGAACVAEGVENEEELQFLHHMGCDKVQGFLLAKPMSIEDVKVLLGSQAELEQVNQAPASVSL